MEPLDEVDKLGNEVFHPHALETGLWAELNTAMFRADSVGDGLYNLYNKAIPVLDASSILVGSLVAHSWAALRTP